LSAQPQRRLCGWIVAPEDRRWTFFWLTFLLFGPLGILAASVASPGDLIPDARPGRSDGYICLRRHRKTQQMLCNCCARQANNAL
jgi:hypothetical protein